MAAQYDYKIFCWQGGLTDAFPQPCRDFKEALDHARSILKSPKWTRALNLRIDGPNGQTWGMAAIWKLV